MAIRELVTFGYGNGTFNGTIANPKRPERSQRLKARMPSHAGPGRPPQRVISFQAKLIVE